VEIDAKIDHLTHIRQILQAVMAANCESLTNCSCGYGRQLSVLELKR
jgi:hypothetical protein